MGIQAAGLKCCLNEGTHRNWGRPLLLQGETILCSHCSPVKQEPGWYQGKDGETALAVPATAPAAPASHKTVQRGKCAWISLPSAFTLGPVGPHPTLGKVSEDCIDISALNWLRKKQKHSRDRDLSFPNGSLGSSENADHLLY